MPEETLFLDSVSEDLAVRTVSGIEGIRDSIAGHQTHVTYLLSTSESRTEPIATMTLRHVPKTASTVEKWYVNGISVASSAYNVAFKAVLKIK